MLDFCESWIFVDLGLVIWDICFSIFGFGISGPSRMAEFC